MNPQRSYSTPTSASDHLAYEYSDCVLWCHICTLPRSDCFCGFPASPGPIYDYSPMNSTTTTLPVTSTNGYTFDPSSYQPAYDPPYTSPPSEVSSTSRSSGPQYSTPKLLPKTSNWSPIAPADKSSDGNGAYSSCDFDMSSKHGKRRGVMAPEEAREKRLQQNRRSQRSFRDRQARMIEDLKTKVEVLTEENQKLVDELSALGLRDESRAGSERGESV
ncbi:hypothetical protein DL98DRAFT_530403 [Cadophora sp. DSE1049]|nr:hypothetical protein DL98DRAFT_530403 [Cadophora sp. DSE1049]